MNKYLYYENKVVKLINNLNKEKNSSIQLVNNLNANACIIKMDKKFIIFVSDKLDKRLLPITLLHEYGHIHFNTIRNNPKKYNYFIELLSNLYAINRLLFLFPFCKKIKLLLLTFYSEKKLYHYFINNTTIKGDILYGEIFKDK